MDRESIKRFVEENPKLVKMRPSAKYPGLYVLKYSKTVFYDDLWNEFLEECRGTVIDKDFNVIARPFTKIYNYGIEKNAPVIDPNEIVTAFRKVNGFMVSVTWYNNDLLVSTTGSLEGPYADMARELIDVAKYQDVCRQNPNVTFMFECVHPNDPHIIEERAGMYLLGYRKNSWDSEVEHAVPRLTTFAIEFDCGRPMSRRCRMCDLEDMAKVEEHEGFVFYTQDGLAAKIKTPYYLTTKWVARNPRTDKLLTEAFMKQIDEEYYGLLHHIRDNIVEYTALDEQARIAFVREFLTCGK
jgi:hypothetical protein